MCTLYFTLLERKFHDIYTLYILQKSLTASREEVQIEVSTKNVDIKYRITVIRYAQNYRHQVRSELPSSGTLRITVIGYTQNYRHQVYSELPSSGTLRITVIRYTQNYHHQVRSELLSSGTLRITVIRYTQNYCLQVHSELP